MRPQNKSLTSFFLSLTLSQPAKLTDSSFAVYLSCSLILPSHFPASVPVLTLLYTIVKHPHVEPSAFRCPLSHISYTAHLHNLPI